MSRPNGGAFLPVYGDPGEPVAPKLAGTPWDPDRDPALEPYDQLDVVRLFAQGKLWKTRTGRWVRVKDMSERHRRATALFLLRTAASWAQRVSMAELMPAFSSDMPDGVVSGLFSADEVRTRDPEAWMRGTKLYRRMLKGLPPVHPAGTCSVCDQIHGPGGAPKPRAAAAGSLPEEDTVTVEPSVWTKVADGVVVVHEQPDPVELRVMVAPKPRDPVTTAAARIALETVLTLLEYKIGRDGPLWTKTPTATDIRNLVAEAARQIGVTL